MAISATTIQNFVGRQVKAWILGMNNNPQTGKLKSKPNATYEIDNGLPVAGMANEVAVFTLWDIVHIQSVDTEDPSAAELGSLTHKAVLDMQEALKIAQDKLSKK